MPDGNLAGASPATRTTLCAIVRDEAGSLLEWVAYHRAIGFDRILVYDNDSTDGTTELCRSLASAGVIDHRPWPDPPAHTAIGPQLPAYEHAAATTSDGWLCFLDADEFLVLEHAKSVDELLATAGRARMPIVLNWRIFGSSGEIATRPGLVIDRFTRCGHVTEHVNRHVKTLGPVSILGERARVHIHGWVLDDPDLFTVDAVGRPVAVESCTFVGPPCWRGAWINHYLVKSIEEFENKRRRGKATHPADAPDKYDRDHAGYFEPYDRNEEEDRTIHRIRGRLAAELASLEPIVRTRTHRSGKHPTSKPEPASTPTASTRLVDPVRNRVEPISGTIELEKAPLIVLPSYGSLVYSSAQASGFIEVVKSQFHELLRSIVKTIEVDETWYLANYLDVADALAEGRIESGTGHYRSAGYFEDRLPRRIVVDDAWYLAAYPDVGAAIAERAFQTAQQHFERDGFREGRSPSKDWTLWTLS